jgi:hypothetical protein
VAVGAPMQARPQPAPLVAYELGEFKPGLLELSFTAGGYFPSKINRVHDILTGWEYVYRSAAVHWLEGLSGGYCVVGGHYMWTSEALMKNKNNYDDDIECGKNY